MQSRILALPTLFSFRSVANTKGGICFFRGREQQIPRAMKPRFGMTIHKDLRFTIKISHGQRTNGQVALGCQIL